MTETVIATNTILAWGTLLLQALTVAVLALFWQERRGNPVPLISWVRRFALPAAFLLALLSSAMTLIYSDVFGFTPCGLCWLQRVFLYPQVFILGLALWRRDSGIADYGIALSVPGLLIALYQHYLQMGGHGVLPCPISTEGADCAQRILFAFNYITFPLMAATVFAALIVLMLLIRRQEVLIERSYTNVYIAAEEETS